MDHAQQQIDSLFKKYNELQKQIHDIKLDHGLLRGRIVSELGGDGTKGNVIKHLDELDKECEERKQELSDLQLWKSNVQGRELVLKFIVGLAGAVLGGITTYFIINYIINK